MTGRQATTLHRLLRYSRHAGGFIHGPDNPLAVDLVVVDEASMMDAGLFASLLGALVAPTRLLLVGDKDQLPSVGCGAVLRDLLACEQVPRISLEHVWRQDPRSWIHQNAQRINRGEQPRIPSNTRECDDFFFVDVPEPADIPGRVQRFMMQTYAQVFPDDRLDPLADVQTLAPTHRGGAGVSALNANLQEALNPLGRRNPKATQVAWHGTTWRLGDRVLQLVNDYDRQVFNGEAGRIVELGRATPDEEGGSIRAGQRVLRVDFGRDDDGRRRVAAYGPKDVGALSLAYAITIHKSQGSEFPIVVVICHSTHTFMLTRQLLYTGSTRAKRRVFLFGDRKGLKRAIGNDRPVQRWTRLGRLLGAVAPATMQPADLADVPI